MVKAMNEKSYGACCRAPSPASWSAFQTRGPVRGSKSFSIEVYVRTHASIRLGHAGTGQARIIHGGCPVGSLQLRLSGPSSQCAPVGRATPGGMTSAMTSSISNRDV
jgi:hypothetical protein